MKRTPSIYTFAEVQGVELEVEVFYEYQPEERDKPDKLDKSDELCVPHY